MKLSAYAGHIGVSYRTAWRWFKAGKLAGFQADTGTIIVTDPTPEKVQIVAPCQVAIYTRVKDMRFKSRLMNRRLRASQLGYIKDKLRFKLDEHGLRYRSVQPAYSSQQCSRCGFVSELNRKSQAEFVCQHCGFVCHADVNAAQNIAERFGDDELNQLPFRAVKALLEARFPQRLSPDGCSPSAGLDTLRKGNAECPQRSISPV
jgi:Putative transposase DNA-binding domain